MPGLKIYTDNSDQSKAENIKLYNDARKWRKDYISYKRWSDTGQGIKMYIDALVIDGLAEDDYNGIYDKYINIYDHYIAVYTLDGLLVLTIDSDGSVPETLTLTTTTTSICLAPASTAFSTNSFTTEAGRCITSPAAIWLATASGNNWIISLIIL